MIDSKRAGSFFPIVGEKTKPETKLVYFHYVSLQCPNTIAVAVFSFFSPCKLNRSSLRIAEITVRHFVADTNNGGNPLVKVEENFNSDKAFNDLYDEAQNSRFLISNLFDGVGIQSRYANLFRDQMLMDLWEKLDDKLITPTSFVWLASRRIGVNSTVSSESRIDLSDE